MFSFCKPLSIYLIANDLSPRVILERKVTSLFLTCILSVKSSMTAELSCWMNSATEIVGKVRVTF